MQKRFLFWTILILLLSMVAEGVSFAVLNLGIQAIRNRIYEPPRISRADFESYLENRHPELGWPGKDGFPLNLDLTGARQSPANERLAESPVCLSLYGDSFTYGSEVRDAEAWSNLLAGRLRCRVANFGVPGYGTDQAVLRFIGNRADDAPLTILGIYPVNLQRNLNQWSLLIAGPHVPFGFKPIFSERGGRAELVGLPDLTYEDYQRLAEDPSQYLKDESYLPGERGGIIVEFPYTLALVRLAWRIFDEIDFDRLAKYPAIPRQWIRGPWYASEGKPNSHAVRRTDLIVRKFVAECSERERRCVVLIIPDWESLYGNLAEGIPEPLDWIYRPFEDVVEVWDATSYIATRTGDASDVCKYIGVRRDCHGHYNAEGYRLLADYVEEKLAGLR